MSRLASMTAAIILGLSAAGFGSGAANATLIEISGTFSGSSFGPDAGSLSSPLASLSGSFKGVYDDTAVGSVFFLTPTEVTVTGIPSLTIANTTIQVDTGTNSVIFGGTLNSLTSVIGGSGDDIFVQYVSGSLVALIYTLDTVVPDGPFSGNGRFRASPGSRSGDVAFNDLTAVPEPGTLALLGIGLAAAGLRRRVQAPLRPAR